VTITKKGYEEEEKQLKMPKSNLDEPVLDLVKLIFDMKLIEKSVVAIGYDVKKLPLG